MTLAAEGVSIRHGGERVLDEVSVEIAPGEVVTIVGPSGTGKTTLLRLLALFGRPDEGAITRDGDDVWGLPDAERLAVRRRIAAVSQEPSLFNASVLRNVTYGLRVRRSWRRRLADGLVQFARPSPPPAAAVEALDTVGLVDRTSQNALSLSGGEAQRVAFARALAVDPDVVLLDEPTSNLDPRNTAVLEGAIERARRRGVGIAVATHDMHQAERISDRVCVLLGGAVIETGPPERIFESPTDPRTRRFVDGELLYDVDGKDGVAATRDPSPERRE